MPDQRGYGSPGVSGPEAGPRSPLVLHRDDGGDLRYGDFLTMPNAAGEPCVWTFKGWLTVAAAHAAGVPLDELATAYEQASHWPEPHTAAFYEGPA